MLDLSEVPGGTDIAGVLSWVISAAGTGLQKMRGSERKRNT
jgi:hypothetical protein